MDPKNRILLLLTPAVTQLTTLDIIPALEHPSDPNHGDYSTNIALQAFGEIKTTREGVFLRKIPAKANNPMSMAEKIVEELNKHKELTEVVERIEVVKPGFINFFLSPNLLASEVVRCIKEEERYGQSEENKGKTVVIDYSAPNIAKPFGIGHLRSTIIGQALYNLYAALGWKTIGDNHLGDWGTQFGTLLYQVTSQGLHPDELDIAKLEELYIEFNTLAEEDPTLRDKAREWFKKLEDGDKQARDIWEKLKEISLEEFNRIYRLLDVEIDWAHGESFYEEILPETIEECVQKGVAREDQGALIIKFKNGLTPAIIRKSDGATTYLTRDLATIKYRLQEWNPDLFIYEVGAEQELHFSQLFQAVEMLGWTTRDRFVHVKHGLYLNPDGKKFSTRRGDTVKLEDVLNEAIERAKKLGSPSDDVAQAVGVGAVKYFDLSHQPESNIVFDWERIMAMEGNSGPYLQYTHARTQSVLLKAGITNFKLQISNLNPEELSVVRYLYRFPEVVKDSANHYSPNLLCNFLFDLAQKYNAFYNKHRILGSGAATEAFRLALTQATGTILKTGLSLLGISAPERM